MSDRLPSFRGPRDLTLSSSAQALKSKEKEAVVPLVTDDKVNKPITPKRVFKPNIPPKRTEKPTKSNEKSQNSSQSQSPTTPVSMSRGQRGQRTFIQSTSVFAEGVGDPLAKKSHVPSMRGGRGGGIGAALRRQQFQRSSGGGGGSRSSVSISDFIKTESEKCEKNDQKNAKSFDEKYNQESNEIFHELKQDPNFAVRLPLSHYTELDIKRETMTGGSLKEKSFIETLTSETLMLLTLPSELPVLLNEETGLTNDISTLPEGFIGKVQIFASGHAKFVIGDNSFDFEKGNLGGFRQDLVSVDLEGLSLKELGPVTHKFLCIPDLNNFVSH